MSACGRVGCYSCDAFAGAQRDYDRKGQKPRINKPVKRGATL